MTTLEIKLKQHTPLIHFQHDQYGATLRASEVKPKLDKFIIRRLKESGEYERGIHEGWIKSKNGKEWLDYKMRIEDTNVTVWGMSRDTGRVNPNNNKPIIESMPLFFGNMHGRDVITPMEKKMVFTPDPISMNLTSRSAALLDVIKMNLNTFFILHGFGTRQSKGFGCFMPEVSNVQQIIPGTFAKFSWRLPNDNCRFGSWDGYFALFTAIDFFYKLLRSGINQNGVYMKSMMYFYAIDMEEYWDKRAIRYAFQHFTPDRQRDRGERSDMRGDGENSRENARLYRDMLGLSSVQTWRAYDNDVITKEHNPINPENKIDRFKSPLLIKPLFRDGQFEVYLIPSPIPTPYLNAEFNISSQRRHQSFCMRTPSRFDVSDLLQFITCEDFADFIKENLTEISNRAEREHKNAARKIAKTLLAIYNNIEYVER